MACYHKFIDHLNLKRLDFEPETLIVGTFNPSIEGNNAEWFYGRRDNNFWGVLPQVYGETAMRDQGPSLWKDFCTRNRVAITDLISAIEDANTSNPQELARLRTYSDKTIANEYKDHIYTPIVDLLQAMPSIKHVYFTRGVSSTFWRKLWKPIENFAKENGLHERKLITPSGYAFYQQGRYNKKNPLAKLELGDFILRDWKIKWHFQ